MIGDPSSKYAYGRSLDFDIIDKAEKKKKFEADLINFIKKDIEYADCTKMTIDQKVDCLRNVFKSFICVEV